MKIAPVLLRARAFLVALALIATIAPAALAADGYLGVMIQTVDETLAAALDLESTDGVLVSDVIEDSPAEAAGLQRGDLILSVNGRGVDSPAQFTRRIRRVDAGEAAELELIRKGQRMTVTATLEEAPEDEFMVRAPRTMVAPGGGKAVWIDEDDGPVTVFPGQHFARFGGGGYLGVNVHSLDADLGRYFGTDEGVLVLGVNEESAAGEAGLKTGDVIVSIDGEKMASTVDLHEALAEFEPGDEVEVAFLRDQREQTLTVELGESPELKLVRGLRGPGGHHDVIMPPAPHHPRQYRLQIHQPQDLHDELEQIRAKLEQLERELEEAGGSE
jgi:serine protease Do